MIVAKPVERHGRAAIRDGANGLEIKTVALEAGKQQRRTMLARQFQHPAVQALAAQLLEKYVRVRVDNLVAHANEDVIKVHMLEAPAPVHVAVIILGGEVEDLHARGEGAGFAGRKGRRDSCLANPAVRPNRSKRFTVVRRLPAARQSRPMMV